MHSLKTYLINRKHVIAILVRYISLTMILYPYVPVLNDGGLAGAFMLSASDDRYSRFLALIITLLPGAMIISEEITQGYYKIFVQRIGLKKYIVSRASCLFASAFTIEASALGLYFITYMLLRPDSFFIGDITLWDLDAAKHSLLWQGGVLGIHILGAFCYCGVFSLVIFAVSAWSDNKYVIYSSAFLVENLGLLIYELNSKLWFINPMEKYAGFGRISAYPVWQQILLNALYETFLAVIALEMTRTGLRKRM